MEKQLIKINRKILTKEKDVNLNLDFIVPDIKPDIVAILDTNANSYIYKEELNDERIRFDGNVDTKVLYLSDSGETRSLAVTLDFSEIIDDSQISPNLRYVSKCILDNIETKIVNERKISLSAKIKICVEFYENKEIELISSLEEFHDIQYKEENYKIKNFIGANKAKASIKENIECDTMDHILDILKSEIKIGTSESKVSHNKVLTKTECDINIVYLTEDMNIKTIKANYPIMSFIDLENVKEDNVLETDTILRNMQIFPIQNEINKISVNLEFETFLEVYEIKEISIIDDIYSLSKVIKFNTKQFDAEIISEKNEMIFSVNESLNVEDISKIINTTSKIRIVGKEKVGTYINYNLEVDVKIMYELDSRRGIAVKNSTFSTMAKIEACKDDLVNFLISNETYNLNNDTISCNIEIKCLVIKNSIKTIAVLDDIVEKDDDQKSEYSMVIYFVKPKDTIWKIAKSFKVSMQSIIDANNIENPDKISIGDKLYIVR